MESTIDIYDMNDPEQVFRYCCNVDIAEWLIKLGPFTHERENAAFRLACNVNDDMHEHAKSAQNADESENPNIEVTERNALNVNDDGVKIKVEEKNCFKLI